MSRRIPVWRALAHSEVPVVIRRGAAQPETATEEPAHRRILVPLDGSPLAEVALPLAEELAAQWKASIFLSQVVSRTAEANEVAAAHAYLQQTAGKLSGTIETHVLTGSVVDALVKAVDDWMISDVVMASRGRTGLARAVLGSVADGLIQRLRCQIVVLPLRVVLAGEHGPGSELDKVLVVQG